MEVDHRNGNGLDNRRFNLREATHAQNMRNQKLNRNNKSGFKGVSYKRSHRKWRACISMHGKTIELGYHDTPEIAYTAYCAGATKYHGEFARY